MSRYADQNVDNWLPRETAGARPLLFCVIPSGVCGAEGPRIFVSVILSEAKNLAGRFCVRRKQRALS
jgi:hypothetical protein